MGQGWLSTQKKSENFNGAELFNIPQGAKFINIIHANVFLVNLFPFSKKKQRTIKFCQLYFNTFSNKWNFLSFACKWQIGNNNIGQPLKNKGNSLVIYKGQFPLFSCNILYCTKMIFRPWNTFHMIRYFTFHDLWGQYYNWL